MSEKNGKEGEILDTNKKDTESFSYNLSEFKFDDKLGIFTHPLNNIVTYEDGGEKYINDVLSEINDKSSYSSELAGYIKDWPSMYHLSPRRNNLLAGLAEIFDKNHTVLEIGSGCGAVTRWLGEHFNKVDAIEGSPSRAAVTKARVMNMENVQVYSGDILHTDFDKKYDIATMIGVLEYLPFYDMRNVDPKVSCTDFLKKIYGSLNEKGTLILAIENKLGIKYFTGCREDHTGKEFDGLSGYPEKSPVTFSRNELEDILREAGFKNIQFFHVFPDYKLTETIIIENDEVLSLKPYNWIRTPFQDYLGERLYTTPEVLLLKTITDSKSLWNFSNSFLVFASKSDAVKLKTDWLIKKFYNNESRHDRKYYHEIVLRKSGDSRYFVKRQPVASGVANVEYSGLEFCLEDEEYYSGELLSLEFYRAMLSSDPKSAVQSIIKKLHDSLVRQYNTGTYDEEGFVLVKGDAIDYTLWNIILSTDGELHFIDRKWRLKKDIPVDFVLFRTLYHIYGNVGPFIYEKNRGIFILDILKNIFPKYSMERLDHDLKLEIEFQSIVHNKKIELNTEYPATYSVSEQAKLNASMRSEIGALISSEKEANERIKNLNSGILDCDSQISSLKANNQNLLAKAEYLELQIKALENEAANRDTKIVSINNTLNESISHSQFLENELNDIKHSITWQFISKYHSFVALKLFKPGTWRGKLYSLGLNSGRILVNEGTGSFWNKNKSNRKKYREKVNIPSNKVHIAESIEDIKTLEKSVSIIIPTKNAGHEFEYTLEKIKNQKGVKSIEIVVVDSGSTDNTVKIAESYGSKVYEIKPEEFNHGKTRNYGVEKAIGDYILFTVQDAIPVGDYWLYNMLKVLENDCKIAAVTCRQLPKSNADLFACFSLWYHYRALDFHKDQVYSLDCELLKMSPMEIRKRCGLEDVCCLIKKDIFEQFKFKDIQYAEDLELGLRLLKSDYQLAFLYSVGIIHSHNRDPAYFIRRNYIDNKLLPAILMCNQKQGFENDNLQEVTENILKLYASLNASIDDLSALPLDENSDKIIFKLKSLITQNLKNGQAGESKIRAKNLNHVLADIRSIVRTNGVNPNNEMIHQYLSLLEAYGEYLRAYPTINSKKEEFFESLYKLFAIIAGSEMAKCYMSRRGNDQTNDVSLAIDALLSEGV